MFYLTKRISENQCTLGDLCMTLTDWPGVPAGTRGVISEVYHEGVMVAWIGVGRKTEAEIIQALKEEKLYAAQGFLTDGFSINELEYLAFATPKHPRVDPKVHNLLS